MMYTSKSEDLCPRQAGISFAISVFISFLLLGAMLAASLFGQTPDRVHEELFHEIDAAIEDANNDDVPLLSPTLFAQAMQAYRKADSEYKKGERLEKIRKNLAKACKSAN